MSEPNTAISESIIKELCKRFNFEVKESSNFNPENTRFSKLPQSEEQKAQMSMLVSQLPTMMAADTLANAYKVVLPNGAAGTLTKLRQGGLSTVLRDTNGSISGTASLFSLAPEAAFLGIFTVMSIATGQFFLAQINKKLDRINGKLDEVLSFLHGDKKAELLSEISFVQYAYNNYDSIMSFNEQRIATIAGLQEARKTAIQDIEFYMNKLNETAKSDSIKDFDDFEPIAHTALEYNSTLELSLQLYVMSCIMETHFSQNFTSGHIKNIEESSEYYITRCINRIIDSFSALETTGNGKNIRIRNKQEDTHGQLMEQIKNAKEAVSGGEKPAILLELKKALDEITKPCEYYLTADGSVYIEQ